MVKRFCNRCHSEVQESTLGDYGYECTSCDEDLYTIETYTLEEDE